MIEFIRADHIHICVPAERLEEAKAFYTTVMGLEQIYRPDDIFNNAGYWFNIGDIQLHIGAARALLTENQIEITEEPVIPGRNRFAFIDPFGNRMELLQRLD
jgi:catechol 2,3-dioxygenase-like lactoylglutathione lyase family enzyme